MKSLWVGLLLGVASCQEAPTIERPVALEEPAVPEKPAGKTSQDEIDKIKLLTRVQVLIEIGKLVEPEKSSAYAFLKEALTKYPNDDEVKTLTESFIKALFAQTDEAIGKMNSERAEPMLSALEDVGANKAEIESRRELLEKFSALKESEASTSKTSAATSADALVQEGDTALKKSKLDDAEHAYKSALKISPKMSSAKLGLARVSFQQLKFTDAINYARDVLKVTPNNIEALIILGDSNYKMYNYKAAVIAYEKALAISPGSAVANRGLEASKKKLASEP